MRWLMSEARTYEFQLHQALWADLRAQRVSTIPDLESILVFIRKPLCKKQIMLFVTR